MRNRIKYFYYRLFSNFTFGKLKKKYIEKKNKYKNKIYYLAENKYNKLIIEGQNNIYDKEKIIKNNIYLEIHGNNNEILFGFSEIKGKNKNLRINIYGDNNKIEIGNNLVIHDYLTIDLAYLPHAIHNSKVSIGNNFCLCGMVVLLLEDNSAFKVGNDCLFSEYIDARLSDTHSVLDLDGNLLNYGGNVDIGNHVWCSREVRILKNFKIGNDSIIGASSVCTKKFDENNVCIGGNPAKIIKKNINWDGCSPQQYINCQNNLNIKQI